MSTPKTITQTEKGFVLASITERFCSDQTDYNARFGNFNYTPAHSKERYDATCTALRSGKPCRVEFKVRDFSSTEYDSMMIEDGKYTNLVMQSIRRNEVPIYISFCNDGVAYAFNLLYFWENSDLVKWIQTTTSKYTMNKGAGRVTKRVGLLPISKAMRLEYTMPSQELVLQAFNEQFVVV